MDLTWLDMNWSMMASRNRGLKVVTTSVDGQDDNRTDPRTSTPSDTERSRRRQGTPRAGIVGGSAQDTRHSTAAALRGPECPQKRGLANGWLPEGTEPIGELCCRI